MIGHALAAVKFLLFGGHFVHAEHQHRSRDIVGEGKYRTKPGYYKDHSIETVNYSPLCTPGYKQSSQIKMDEVKPSVPAPHEDAAETKTVSEETLLAALKLGGRRTLEKIQPEFIDMMKNASNVKGATADIIHRTMEKYKVRQTSRKARVLLTRAPVVCGTSCSVGITIRFVDGWWLQDTPPQISPGLHDDITFGNSLKIPTTIPHPVSMG